MLVKYIVFSLSRGAPRDPAPLVFSSSVLFCTPRSRSESIDSDAALRRATDVAPRGPSVLPWLSHNCKSIRQFVAYFTSAITYSRGVSSPDLGIWLTSSKFDTSTLVTGVDVVLSVTTTVSIKCSPSNDDTNWITRDLQPAANNIQTNT